MAERVPARVVEEEYLTLQALARYSGLSVRTLRSRLVDLMHPLPHYRVVGRILVRRCDFDAWLLQFRTEGRAAGVNLGAIVDDVMAGL